MKLTINVGSTDNAENLLYKMYLDDIISIRRYRSAYQALDEGICDKIVINSSQETVNKIFNYIVGQTDIPCTAFVGDEENGD